MPFDSLQDAQVAAARLAAVADLQAIVLRDLDWSFPEKKVPAGLPITIDTNFDLQVAKDPGRIFYRVRANIAGQIPDHGELFTLKVLYQLVYAVPVEEDFAPAEMEGYGSASVLFMVFPYIRHALQDMAGRSGLPPLLLAPLRLPFERDQAEDRT